MEIRVCCFILVLLFFNLHAGCGVSKVKVYSVPDSGEEANDIGSKAYSDPICVANCSSAWGSDDLATVRIPLRERERIKNTIKVAVGKILLPVFFASNNSAKVANAASIADVKEGLVLPYATIGKLARAIRSLLKTYPEVLVGHYVIYYFDNLNIFEGSLYSLYLELKQQADISSNPPLSRFIRRLCNYIVQRSLPDLLNGLLQMSIDVVKYQDYTRDDKKDALRKINGGFLPLHNGAKEEIIKVINLWLTHDISGAVIADIVVKFFADNKIYPRSIEGILQMIKPAGERLDTVQRICVFKQQVKKYLSSLTSAKV